ncbi:hypothetical protein J6590_023623 [Homalodisca vitripennis]|nr:hypothetical protein J6590_023623 [Homalodisca vitripennis]
MSCFCLVSRRYSQLRTNRVGTRCFVRKQKSVCPQWVVRGGGQRSERWVGERPIVRPWRIPSSSYAGFLPSRCRGFLAAILPASLVDVASTSRRHVTRNYLHSRVIICRVPLIFQFVSECGSAAVTIYSTLNIESNSGCNLHPARTALKTIFLSLVKCLLCKFVTAQ